MTQSEFEASVADSLAEIGAYGVQQKGDQFAIWFATAILGHDRSDVLDRYRIGGAGDNKIDIGIIDEGHDVIFIVQSRYSDSPRTKVFSTDLAEEPKNARERLLSVPDAGNQRRRNFAALYSQVRSARPERLIAVGYGRFSRDAELYAQANDIELYGYDKLKEIYEIEVSGDIKPPATLTIHVRAREIIHRRSTDPVAEEWITVANAEEIFAAVKAYKHALFARNLRYKLTETAKTAISGTIKATIKQRPEALLLFNNGLTFIAQRVQPTNDGTGLILSHPQIVNGCQTSWAIYDTFSDLKATGTPLRAPAEMLVKIVQTAGDAGLADEIARFTNQQNAITERDLRANFPEQKGIAEAFARLSQPIYYEYKEGASQALASNQKSRFQVAVPKGRPPLRSIENTFAGQLYLAMLGKPASSKQDKKQIFSKLYEPIFGVNLAPDVRFDDGFKPPEEPTVGADGFRDDVLFALQVSRLADAIKGLYEKKLDQYEGQSLGEIEKRALRTLQRVGAYRRFWQYLLVASIATIARLWARRNNTTLDAIGERLFGGDLDQFFVSTRTRQGYFTVDTNLAHAYVLDEEHPSQRFKAFTVWARALEKKLEVEIQREAEDPTDPTEWSDDFRMQGFVDQDPKTFEKLYGWVLDQYNQGPQAWRTAFPLPPRAKSSQPALPRISPVIDRKSRASQVAKRKKVGTRTPNRKKSRKH